MKESPFVTASSPASQSTSSKKRRSSLNESADRPSSSKRHKGDQESSVPTHSNEGASCQDRDDSASIRQVSYFKT